MLTPAMEPIDAATAFDFAALRASEFARLDAAGIAYLDYAASALYGASQACAHGERLARGIFGNPHSEHLASRNSAAAQAAARAATLAFFDADPDIYEVCFTANATAAIKLVAESYSFSLHRGLILSTDNHNSVNGVREFARRAQAPISTLPLDEQLRLDHASAQLRACVNRRGAGLFAFPQQSNFSGVQHDLSLVEEAQALGCDVLLDAAAAGPSGTLSLREHAADFVACSFYKLFGLPTGVGALIAKRSALDRLRRPWFSGGTVKFVSVAHDRHSLKPGHEAFEDGTPNFLDLAAIESGFAFLARMPRLCLRAHIQSLVRRFLALTATLRHRNGSPLVHLYGPLDVKHRGGIVAFNVLRDDGSVVPYEHVERMAHEHGVAIRGGCFCNPGAAEKAFGFDAAGCFDRLEGDCSIDALRRYTGGAVAVGALRLSVGAPAAYEDIERAASRSSAAATCHGSHKAKHAYDRSPHGASRGYPLTADRCAKHTIHSNQRNHVKIILRLTLPLLLLSASAHAIVTRHDQPDARYRVSPQAIPALADLPDEGHGTLIAPRWVLTAAHAVNMMQTMPEEHFVTINGTRRAVSRIVVYPDYPAARIAWQRMFEQVKTAKPDIFAHQYEAAMAAMHDIALLELTKPVTDVAPMPIDRDNAKPGMLSTVYGAGATGTDLTGAPDSESHRTQLRRAQNRLTQSDGPWLRYVFDCSVSAPALSGATAGGDSGGPVTIDVAGRTYLAGITHGLDATASEEEHIVRQMQDGAFRMGVCGQRFAAARVGFYAAWIDQTIAGY